MQCIASIFSVCELNSVFLVLTIPAIWLLVECVEIQWYFIKLKGAALYFYRTIMKIFQPTGHTNIWDAFWANNVCEL